MSSINSDFDDVHLGFWINWSFGRTRGATLTMTRDNGTLLIAFLAIFVAAAGKSFWRILSFAIHTSLSEPTAPQDGVYHQRQAVLRNSETAFNGAWQLLNVAVVWKHRHIAPRVLRRCMPIITLAILLSCGFTLAGIFASRVSDDGYSEVLLSGSQCGYADDDIDYQKFKIEYEPLRTNIMQSGLSYARSCYKEGRLGNACKTYVKPRLPFNSDRNATCPFSDDICHWKFGNIKVDTGHISIHKHMGLNIRLEDRVTFRLIHHCAPLKTVNFSRYDTVLNERNGFNVSIFRLFYGEWVNWTDIRPGYSNYTYQFPANETRESFDNGDTFTAPVGDYAVGAASYTPKGGIPTYIEYSPVPQLRKVDSDIALFFLSAPDILFRSKVTDPWFSAQTPANTKKEITTMKESDMMYVKDEPVTALGCTRQTQYCLEDSGGPDERKCERLRGHLDADLLWNSTLTERQRKIIKFMARFTIPEMIERIATNAGPIFLMARSGLKGSEQGPLATNQWQLEIENLVAAVLANIQRSIIDGVNGPPTLGIADLWHKPNDTVWQELCHCQKVLSSRFPSFSVLGISLIFGIGGSFIFLELLLERMTRKHSNEKDSKTTKSHKNSGKGWKFFRRLRKPAFKNQLPITQADGKPSKLVHECAEWNLNSTLQLQRLAHEGVGAGTWERTSREIPVILPNQNLGILSFKNSTTRHPYFVNPGVDHVPSVPMNDKDESTVKASLSDNGVNDSNSIKDKSTAKASLSNKGVNNGDGIQDESTVKASLSDKCVNDGDGTKDDRNDKIPTGATEIQSDQV